MIHSSSAYPSTEPDKYSVHELVVHALGSDLLLLLLLWGTETNFA